MAYPKKKERNKQILKLRQKGWSFRKLADHFNINVKTAFEIVKNEMLGVVDK